MPIEVTIIKSPGDARSSNSSHTFSESGGTIGRGSDNTWVLDDPEKYMSSIHTQIGCENGQYTLTDLSTNGTFVNGSTEPLGSGSKVNLNEGDRFTISDYEFVVNIRAASQNGDALFSQPIDQGPFPEMGQVGSGSFEAQDDPFGSPANGYVPLSDASFGFDNVETDPLAMLDKADSNHHLPYQNDPLQSSSFSDSGDAVNDSIDWPDANIENGMIPDNWDADNDLPENRIDAPNHVAIAPGTAANSVPTNTVSNAETLSNLEKKCLILEQENKKLVTEVARLNNTIDNLNHNNRAKKSQPERAITAQDRTLAESMGLSKWNLDDHKMVQVSATAGLLVRETMEGMMQVLSFRKKIKEEFRINVTTIQPVENNPLKFSANIDDAMENMFIKENNAYKEPIEAVREGFQGISEHQIAVLAGMQAAFRGMLERLDPEMLEKRFEKYKKSSVIQFGQRRKHWESYKEYHAELSDNLDNSFQHLFGYDFVQAYEEQMQRLVSARKAK